MRLLGRGVKCVRGGREVFSELDFTASSGEALAVTGPNGSGKTSLLRIVAGLLTLAAGSIGLEDGERELTVAEQAHYLGHRDAMKPALSVLENLAFWRDFLGGEASDADHSLVAVRRPIWLLDEPTSALDTAGQSLFSALMRDHLARGGLIVAATHAPLGIEAKELRIGGVA